MIFIIVHYSGYKVMTRNKNTLKTYLNDNMSVINKVMILDSHYNLKSVASPNELC